jgi:hypothetical protein
MLYIGIIIIFALLINISLQLKQIKMTADVQAALATFTADLNTLLTDVSAKLQAIATAPTTDPDTVNAVKALDAQVTAFTSSLITPPTTGA